MIVGPAKVLLMDEISNGLDSSTTFQIVTCLQQLTHITGSTILVSLLQPAPETFDLFDDIILMAEGKTVYHGPRDDILDFFEKCGFRCPPRKGIADFLQQVRSLLIEISPSIYDQNGCFKRYDLNSAGRFEKGSSPILASEGPALQVHFC